MKTRERGPVIPPGPVPKSLSSPPSNGTENSSGTADDLELFLNDDPDDVADAITEAELGAAMRRDAALATGRPVLRPAEVVDVIAQAVEQAQEALYGARLPGNETVGRVVVRALLAAGIALVDVGACS